ncbi:MAG: hypothetical protein Q4C47_02285, partial [Planctomycetia bacterium]|nr:hypothetical protein [Planctomycetia bacterium]
MDHSEYQRPGIGDSTPEKSPVFGPSLTDHDSADVFSLETASLPTPAMDPGPAQTDLSRTDSGLTGLFPFLSTTGLRLNARSGVNSIGSNEKYVPPHPRTHLLVAGLVAFVAWGTAMAVLWRNVRTDYRPDPPDVVAKILKTLSDESDRLRERQRFPRQSYLFPGETPFSPRPPELVFDPDELRLLKSYIAEHPPEPDEEKIAEGSGEKVESGRLPGAPEPESDGESSMKPPEGSSESSGTEDIGPELMTPESERLVQEILRCRLEGNTELERALSRYPDDPEAVLLVASYFRCFSQPTEAIRAGQLAIDFLTAGGNSGLPTPVESETSPSHDPSGFLPISAKSKTADPENPGASEEVDKSNEVARPDSTSGSDDADAQNVRWSDEWRTARLRGQAWRLMGEISLEMGQTDTAVTLFRSCADAERSSDGAVSDAMVLSLAESLVISDRADEACTTLEPLLAAHPRCLPALTLRGCAQLRNGNISTAMEDFRTVTELAPD